MNFEKKNCWISTFLITGIKVNIFAAIPKYYACYFASEHSTYLKFIDVETLKNKKNGEYIFLKEHSKEGIIQFKSPSTCSIDKIEILLHTEIVQHVLGSGKKNVKSINVSIQPNTDYTLKLNEISADKVLVTKKQGDHIMQLFVCMYSNSKLVMKVPMLFLNSLAVPSQYGILTSYIDITNEEKNESFGEGKLISERNGKRPDYIIQKGDLANSYVQSESHHHVLPFGTRNDEILPPKKPKKKNQVKTPIKNLKTKSPKKS